MILGFGTSEVAEANKILGRCRDAFIENGQEGLDAIEAEYKELDEKYHNMDRSECPSRYTRFWSFAHKIYEGFYHITFSMHHINRQHPFSPDGWALLQSKYILSMKFDEDTKEWECQQYEQIG